MSNLFQYLANESDNDDLENEIEDTGLPQNSTEQEAVINSPNEDNITLNNSNQEQSQNQDGQTQEKEEKSNQSIDLENLDRLTPEEIANCPTVFEALGMSENRKVLFTFLGISLALVVVGFGSFFLGKKLIPVIFKSIDPYDAPIYSCGLAVVLTQIIVFSFFFWAWKHDVAAEKKERELEERIRKEKLKRKLKKD